MLSIDLSGKTALVTGASKGIGKGIAKILSMAGAKVIIVSRSYENLYKTAKEISSISNNEVYFFTADLTNMVSLESLISKIHSEVGNIDIFVFNTGGPKPGYFKELNLEDWEFSVKLLLYPAVYLTKTLIDDMVTQKWGRIIYSTSVAIKEPILGLTLSNVVRISMAGLIRTLSKEYGPYGITVNGIMPGYIATERVEEIARKKAEERKISFQEIIREMTKNIPAGRMGFPEEIGYLVAYLSSEYAAYINGAIIPVDGGLLNSSL